MFALFEMLTTCGHPPSSCRLPRLPAPLSLSLNQTLLLPLTAPGGLFIRPRLRGLVSLRKAGLSLPSSVQWHATSLFGWDQNVDAGADLGGERDGLFAVLSRSRPPPPGAGGHHHLLGRYRYRVCMCRSVAGWRGGFLSRTNSGCQPAPEGWQLLVAEGCAMPLIVPSPLATGRPMRRQTLSTFSALLRLQSAGSCGLPSCLACP